MRSCCRLERRVLVSTTPPSSGRFRFWVLVLISSYLDVSSFAPWERARSVASARQPLTATVRRWASSLPHLSHRRLGPHEKDDLRGLVPGVRTLTGTLPNVAPFAPCWLCVGSLRQEATVEVFLAGSSEERRLLDRPLRLFHWCAGQCDV